MHSKSNWMIKSMHISVFILLADMNESIKGFDF